MNDLPEHVRRNRVAWDAWASEYAAAGERAWALPQPTWGIWDVPESELALLPDDLAGKDAIELGCGTAYVSAWMARRGARVVGIDNSEAQLATARRLQREHGLDFPLLHGNAEAGAVPGCVVRLRDLRVRRLPVGRSPALGARSGAPVAPRRAPRLSRQLVPDGAVHAGRGRRRGHRSAATPGVRPLPPRVSGRVGVEFHPSHGDWIRLLRQSGFEIEDLIEVWPTADATTRYPFVTIDWARQWPAEEVWKVRKRG